MDRRELLAASAGALAGATAGRLGFGDPEPGRLDLTVRNACDAPVDVDVVVEGDCGTTYGAASDRRDAETVEVAGERVEAGRSLRKVTYCRRENLLTRWTSTRG